MLHTHFGAKETTDTMPRISEHSKIDHFFVIFGIITFVFLLTLVLLWLFTGRTAAL